MNTNNTSNKQPSVLAFIRAELAKLVKISQQYRETINASKTSIKRKFYFKKLKKNNKRIMQMLVAADRLVKQGEHVDDNETEQA